MRLRPIDLADPVERAALVDFMSSEPFPLHAGGTPTRDEVTARIERGEYSTHDQATYWVEDHASGRIGIARLQDLSDDTPMFDLRLGQRHRGRRLGTAALRALTDLVFSTCPQAHRFEGVTRADNLPMRRAFLRVGFVQEAHYRQGWPQQDDTMHDAVGYAVLRQDWETGTTTPVPRDEGQVP